MPMSDYMRRVRSKLGSDLLEIPSVSILVFDAQERALLIRHAEVDAWTTPGGAVEPRESPADAAVREAWEETGLHVELVRLLGVYGGPEFTTTYRNGDAVSFAMMVFEGRPIGGALRADGEEALEVGWFSPEELAGVPHQSWVLPVLLHAREGRERPHFDPPRWQPPRS